MLQSRYREVLGVFWLLFYGRKDWNRLSRRAVLLGVSGLLLVGVLGVVLFVRQRQEQCAYVPLVGEELLPNAGLAPGAGSNMPESWNRAADGVELRGKAVSQNQDEWGFDLDGDGRTLQLLGIANYVETPLILVQPNQSYCFVGLALTDSEKQSATRVQVVFDWRDTFGKPLREDTIDWQPVALWREGTTESSRLRAAAKAPDHAAQLHIRVEPSSDDRVYLDAMHVRRTTDNRQPTTDNSVVGRRSSVVVMPWPNGAPAAVSFTFDWETAMGGLIHTRSSTAEDPNYATDPITRALRMRDGVTTTLDLFRPYAIQATYYATGYNFLEGNTERRIFMGNPTYDWATQENRFNEKWLSTPWFADDPYGTVRTDPAWYFGDLVPMLQAEQQDIQSHTFAHFPATYVKPADWQQDFAAWRQVAAERGVAPAQSLAFPWSSTAGMSDDDWNALAANGITSVTRTYWAQAKSALFPRDTRAADGMVIDPRCRSVPGHETILACPDFYLTQTSAPTATRMIDRAIAVGGMIDLWAHTEEVTSPEQIAAWTDVVRYAAEKRDAGELWIAPLSVVAERQRATDQVRIQNTEYRIQNAEEPMKFSIENTSKIELLGLTLKMPMKIQRASVNGKDIPILNSEFCILDLPGQQAIEVTVWPA